MLDIITIIKIIYCIDAALLIATFKYYVFAPVYLDDSVSE